MNPEGKQHTSPKKPVSFALYSIWLVKNTLNLIKVSQVKLNMTNTKLIQITKRQLGLIIYTLLAIAVIKLAPNTLASNTLTKTNQNGTEQTVAENCENIPLSKGKYQIIKKWKDTNLCLKIVPQETGKLTVYGGWTFVPMNMNDNMLLTTRKPKELAQQLVKTALNVEQGKAVVIKPENAEALTGELGIFLGLNDTATDQIKTNETYIGKL